MRSTQFNIRLPTDLARDLSLVARLLKVNKSEFVKVKLASMVREEKAKLLAELKTLLSKNLITKAEYRQLVREQYGIK